MSYGSSTPCATVNAWTTSFGLSCDARPMVDTTNEMTIGRNLFIPAPSLRRHDAEQRPTGVPDGDSVTIGSLRLPWQHRGEAGSRIAIHDEEAGQSHHFLTPRDWPAVECESRHVSRLSR